MHKRAYGLGFDKTLKNLRFLSKVGSDLNLDLAKLGQTFEKYLDCFRFSRRVASNFFGSKPNRTRFFYLAFLVIEGQGVFTIKSCYRFLQGECADDYKLLWKKIWAMKLPRKVTHVL